MALYQLCLSAIPKTIYSRITDAFALNSRRSHCNAPLIEAGDDSDGGMVGWLTEHGLMGAVDGLGANYRLIKLGRFLLQMPVI